VRRRGQNSLFRPGTRPVVAGETRRLRSALPSPSDGWGVHERGRLCASGAPTHRDDRCRRGRVARFRHPALRQRNGSAQPHSTTPKRSSAPIRVRSCSVQCHRPPRARDDERSFVGRSAAIGAVRRPLLCRGDTGSSCAAMGARCGNGEQASTRDADERARSFFSYRGPRVHIALSSARLLLQGCPSERSVIGASSGHSTPPSSELSDGRFAAAEYGRRSRNRLSAGPELIILTPRLNALYN
jgi:hypothetical protein